MPPPPPKKKIMLDSAHTWDPPVVVDMFQVYLIVSIQGLGVKNNFTK